MSDSTSKNRIVQQTTTDGKKTTIHERKCQR